MNKITLQFLGCMFCGFLVAPFAEGTISRLSVSPSSSMGEVTQDFQVNNDVQVRRDPFRPIEKPQQIVAPSRKVHADPSSITPSNSVSYPNWKLLGIIQGQYESQAVIQVSPKKRVFVSVGLEVDQSGWVIKTISHSKVFLVHSSLASSSSSSEKDFSDTKTFILSFSML